MKSLQTIVSENSTKNAQRAALFVAERATEAILEHGSFYFAVSGGSTPVPMFEALRELEINWSKFHIFQVDERLAPTGPDQNFHDLSRTLLEHVPLSPQQIHCVDTTLKPEEARLRYQERIENTLGQYPVLDLVHLGLGGDGHTASLVPNDPVLQSSEDIGLTAPYMGFRRVTMTYLILNRARQRMWLVAGRDKQQMLENLRTHRGDIPANGIHGSAVIFTDQDARPSMC